MKLSHYSAPVTGGTEVILLCDRVAKGKFGNYIIILKVLNLLDSKHYCLN